MVRLVLDLFGIVGISGIWACLNRPCPPVYLSCWIFCESLEFREFQNFRSSSFLLLLVGSCGLSSLYSILLYFIVLYYIILCYILFYSILHYSDLL